MFNEQYRPHAIETWAWTSIYKAMTRMKTTIYPMNCFFSI